MGAVDSAKYIILYPSVFWPKGTLPKNMSGIYYRTDRICFEWGLKWTWIWHSHLNCWVELSWFHEFLRSTKSRPVFFRKEQNSAFLLSSWHRRGQNTPGGGLYLVRAEKFKAFWLLNKRNTWSCIICLFRGSFLPFFLFVNRTYKSS